jgi:hypothetical protein
MNTQLKELEDRRTLLLGYSDSQRDQIVASAAALSRIFSRENIVGGMLYSRRVAGAVGGFLLFRWLSKRLAGWFEGRSLRKPKRRGGSIWRFFSDRVAR